MTFGDSLGVPESLIKPYTLCSGPCTLSTTVSPERLAYFRAPISGMIVRWRIQTIEGSAVQMIALRVLAPVAGDMFDGALGEQFTGAGTSEAVPAPTEAGTFTFPARLPVEAGDFIGVNTEGGALAAVAEEEESIRMFEPTLGELEPASSGKREDYALLVNADVAAPPVSGAISGCSRSGVFGVSVTADPDPAVSTRALHVRVDGGAETSIGLVGNPASASIAVPAGAHSVEYWAEDTLGQQESPHHLASVLVDDTPPDLTITSDQATTSYIQGEHASVTVTAGDPLAALTSDPSASHLAIATATPGTFVLARSARDVCGNSASASFTYRVTPAPRLSAVRIRPPSFRAARSGASRTGPGAGPGAPAGAEVTYIDAAAARSTFTIQRLERGTLEAGRCTRRTHARRAENCELFVAVAGFSRSDRAGANSFRLTGRAGGRALAPGAYRLQAQARAAGVQPAAPVYVAFDIRAS